MPYRESKNLRLENFSHYPLYPLFVGIYPVLTLAAYNLTQVDLSQTYRSFLFSLILAFFLFGLARLALQDWPRAAFLTGSILILFFSYGHVYNFLSGMQVFSNGWGRHIFLSIVWAVLLGMAAWMALRKSIDFRSATPALNIFSAVLFIYPLFQIGSFEIKKLSYEQEGLKSSAPTVGVVTGKPDIYYIILDAYERADTMKLVYGYDNSAFLNDLAARGFYVAPCSQSNYAYTQPSLASSLNLDYLDTLSIHSNAQADPLLQENAVRRYLKAQGYRIVAFESGFSWSQWEDADTYYRYRADPAYLNGFEALFLRTTFIRLPLDRLYSDQDATHGVIPYQRILYDLDTLKKLPETGGLPKFVFMHLSIPHPPFVFGPEGEFVTAGAENATSVEGYRNSVTFINRQILQVVDDLLSKSSRPPVIVLQGDHGAPRYNSPLQRMTILNAYYLPGISNSLSPTISPVNTFRLIFNAYFGQHYPLLKDVSYYSYPNQEYEFGEIPNECRK